MGSVQYPLTVDTIPQVLYSACHNVSAVVKKRALWRWGGRGGATLGACQGGLAPHCCQQGGWRGAHSGESAGEGSRGSAAGDRGGQKKRRALHRGSAPWTPAKGSRPFETWPGRGPKKELWRLPPLAATYILLVVLRCLPVAHPGGAPCLLALISWRGLRWQRRLGWSSIL